MNVREFVDRVVLFVTDDVFGCGTYFQTSDQNRARRATIGGREESNRVGRVSRQYQPYRGTAISGNMFGVDAINEMVLLESNKRIEGIRERAKLSYKKAN